MHALRLLVAVLVTAGCSRGSFPTASVEGIVRCNGVQLTSGVVYFSPVAGDGKTIVGKSGGGVVSPDGRFTISTYTEGDGAVVGQHRVVWQAEEEHAERAGPACSREAFAIVEVPPEGVLDLEVNLMKAPN
jgi:hypothetical protein